MLPEKLKQVTMTNLLCYYRFTKAYQIFKKFTAKTSSTNNQDLAHITNELQSLEMSTAFRRTIKIHTTIHTTYS